MSEWISVKDRLPKHRQIVDIWVVSEDGYGSREIDVEYDNLGCLFIGEDDYDPFSEFEDETRVTHWMEPFEPPGGVNNV